jgi:hypothetical protein
MIVAIRDGRETAHAAGREKGPLDTQISMNEPEKFRDNLPIIQVDTPNYGKSVKNAAAAGPPFGFKTMLACRPRPYAKPSKCWFASRVHA